MHALLSDTLERTYSLLDSLIWFLATTSVSLFLLLIVCVACYISARKLTVSMIFNVRKTSVVLSDHISIPEPCLRQGFLGLVPTSHETEVVKWGLG